MTYRGEFVHDASVAAVVVHFALDVLEGVLLCVCQDEVVSIEQLFAKGVLRRLGLQALTDGVAPVRMRVVLPRLLGVVEEEDEEHVGQGEWERPADDHEQEEEGAADIHGVGYMIEVATLPVLVVVARPAGHAEQIVVLIQKPSTFRSIWLIDEVDELVERESRCCRKEAVEREETEPFNERMRGGHENLLGTSQAILENETVHVKKMPHLMGAVCTLLAQK